MFQHVKHIPLCHSDWRMIMNYWWDIELHAPGLFIHICIQRARQLVIKPWICLALCVLQKSMPAVFQLPNNGFCSVVRGLCGLFLSSIKLIFRQAIAVKMGQFHCQSKLKTNLINTWTVFDTTQKSSLNNIWSLKVKIWGEESNWHWHFQNRILW